MGSPTVLVRNGVDEELDIIVFKLFLCSEFREKGFNLLKKEASGRLGPSTGTSKPARNLLLCITSSYLASLLRFNKLIASASLLPTSHINQNMQIREAAGANSHRIHPLSHSDSVKGLRSTKGVIHEVIAPDLHQQLFMNPI